MHPQLRAIRSELEASSDRVSRLADWAGAERWVTRPTPESWSPSECVQHLNMTSESMTPLIRARLAGSARAAGQPTYRFNFMGWLIWRSTSPPAKVKYKTPAPFVPPDTRPMERDLVAWAVCQSDVITALEAADGYPLNKLRIISPFDGRVRYNLYASFRIIAAHQRRHLDQAEKAITALRGTG